MTAPTAAARLALGRLGEETAASYLVGQGYQIVERNWRAPGGELDLIATQGDWLVVVEVRSRRAGRGGRDPNQGLPEESIRRRKQQRLVRLAETYVYEKGWTGYWRIDVIALEIGREGQVVRLNHLPDAVGGFVGG